MKALGKEITDKVKDLKGTQTEIDMKEISKREKLTAKVFITGQMEKYMMASGPKESKMDMACGEESSEIVIWDSGI